MVVSPSGSDARHVVAAIESLLGNAYHADGLSIYDDLGGYSDIALVVIG